MFGNIFLTAGAAWLVKSVLDIAKSHNIRNYSTAIGEIPVLLFIVCVYEWKLLGHYKNLHGL
jgi:L-rhamnose mutarotase